MSTVLFVSSMDTNNTNNTNNTMANVLFVANADTNNTNDTMANVSTLATMYTTCHRSGDLARDLGLSGPIDEP